MYSDGLSPPGEPLPTINLASSELPEGTIAHMSKSMLALLLLLSGALQKLPAPFPRDTAKQLIDNERVTVWDVTWPKGVETAWSEGKFDMVSIELVTAAIKVTSAKGKSKAVAFKPGQASFIEKGTVQMEA